MDKKRNENTAQDQDKAAVCCPASPRYSGDIAGCGSTNLRHDTHEDGMYDCLDCGMFFKHAEAQAE